MSWLAIIAALKRISWPVWAALALLAAWGIDRTMQYRQGYRECVASFEQRLRDAEAESLKKAAIAARTADTKAEERALVEAETRARDLQAIEKAKADDTNALDSLFGG